MNRLSMLRVLPALLVLGACVELAAFEAQAQAPTPATTPSLYKRLGGYDAIAAVTDDFVPRLVGDPQLSRFFVGHGADSKMRIRQRVVDMVCMASGGPCLYFGRDMKSAHKGLGITEADWTTMSNHFVATLDKFKVGQKEKDDLIALVNGLKKDIVEPPATSR
jgi:hemoglobin